MAESIIVVKLGGTEGVDFSAICQDAVELLKQGKKPTMGFNILQPE